MCTMLWKKVYKLVNDNIFEYDEEGLRLRVSL